MSVKKRKPSAGQSWPSRRVFRTVLEAAAWVVPLGCVAFVNLSTTTMSNLPLVIVGLMSAVAGGLCIHVAMYRFPVAWRVVCAIIGFVCIVYNCENAIRNLGAHSDSSRAGLEQTAETVTAKKDQLNQARTERKALKFTATDEAAVRAATAMAAAATSAKEAECTKRGSRCREKEAAEAMALTAVTASAANKALTDQARTLDVKITRLDGEIAKVPAVTSSDPFADEVASMLMLAGYEVNKGHKLLVAHVAVWSAACLLEVLGEFLPSLLLMLLGRAFAPAIVAPAARRETQGVSVKTHPVEDENAADRLSRFCADCLEFVGEEKVDAGALFDAWTAWCHQEGLTPGTNTAFGLLANKRGWQRVKSNGKTYRLGLRLRMKGKPALRVVAG